MDTVGLRVGPDEAEPFFGDDECDDECRVSEDEACAEVHHGVDVASSGPRHSYHLSQSSDLLRFSWIHRVRTQRLWSLGVKKKKDCSRCHRGGEDSFIYATV